MLQVTDKVFEKLSQKLRALRAFISLKYVKMYSSVQLKAELLSLLITINNYEMLLYKCIFNVTKIKNEI